MASQVVGIPNHSNGPSGPSTQFGVPHNEQDMMVVSRPNQPHPHQQQEMVKLSLIIERAVQTAYHELIVLAELLPRKPDVERKVELCKWCVKTRQMFVRVFALAKWVNGAAKVDKSTHMTDFLHTQANYFVMTADRLHCIANEDLANAKLPTFYIPHAVDVLSTGSFPRLPCAIRDKVVPPEKATPTQKASTLRKLDKIIPCFLADSDFPKEFSEYQISGGRVTFTVEKEFKVTLTLFGVDSSLPWRILDILFLIRDDSVGEGAPLVHELQKNYLVAFLQTKLNAKEFHLTDVYHYLHRFCLHLKLEVIHAQLLCLAMEQRNPYIGVESYKVGKELSIFYWKEMKRQLGKPVSIHDKFNATAADREASTNLFTILITLEESSGAFAVSHFPKLEAGKHREGEIGDLFFESTCLKISALLSKTIFIRSQTALRSALAFLTKNSPTFPATFNESEPSISLQVLHPMVESETIKITVQPKTGMFIVRCTKLTVQTCVELEIAINKESASYKSKLETIRKNFLLDRVRNSLYGLSCSIVESPSFTYSASHPYSTLPDSKVFLQIESNGRYFVVVCIECNNGFVSPTYYLLQLFQPKVSSVPLASGTSNKSDRIVVYKPIQIASLLPLDASKCCRSHFAILEENDDLFVGKSRKLDVDNSLSSGYEVGNDLVLPGLRDVVCSCYARFLGSSLEDAVRRVIPGAQFTTSLFDESPCVTITKMPSFDLGSVSNESQASFKRCVLLIQMRARVYRNNRSVMGITLVVSAPAPALSKSKSSGVIGGHKLLHLESVLEINRWATNNFFLLPMNKLVIQWKHMLKLYDEYSIVKQYIESFGQGFSVEKPWLEIESYNCEKLVIAYGPRQSCLITFFSSHLDRSCHATLCPDMLKSKITFSTKYNATNALPDFQNPHIGTAFELIANAEYLRPETQILDLLYSLHITCRPLNLLSSLDRQVKVGVSFCNRPTDFCHSSSNVIHRSITKVSVFYRFIFVVDIEFCKDHVFLSDGSLSRFSDASKTPSLKSDYAPQKLENFHWFLSKVLINMAAAQTASHTASMFVSISNSSMSPEPFQSINLETPTSATPPGDFPAFPEMTTSSVTLSSQTSTDSDSMSRSSLTPKLTLPMAQKMHNFESPELECKMGGSFVSELSEFELAQFDNGLPNSCVKLSYRSFGCLFEKRVQCQDSNKTKMSVVELYLAWTFIKWDLLNQITESVSHQDHSLKLSGPNGLVTVLGIREDFLGLYMKLFPSADLKPSAVVPDDISVMEDASAPLLSTDQSKFISESDQKFLQRYFQHQIAVLPFRAPLFLAWCYFLLLPSFVVSDFASILRFETTPSTDHLWLIKVTWTFPMQQISNVAINKIGNTCIRRSSSDSVMFLFTFTSKASGRQLELPLSYNWTSGVVTPAIQNSVFHQFITEATHSIANNQSNSGNLQSSFLSNCIEYILTRMSENV